MKSFITVHKNSPDFLKYLEGTFSEAQVAIPLESVNVNSQSESITFELLDKKEIQLPDLKEFLSSLLKIYKFLYVLFPVFYISLYYYVNAWNFDVTTMILSAIASLLLFIGVNLRSDYWDHIRGLDRVIRSNQSKPIVRGWIKAATVKKLSLILMFAALVLSIPVIIAFPKVLVVILLAGGLIYLGMLQGKTSYRDYFVGDLFWALLVGPMLAVGFELAISGQWHWQFLVFGCVWGGLIFFRLQLNNFEFLLAGSLAGVKNLINQLGFEGGKKFIIINWLFFIFLFTVFQWLYFHWMIWIATVVALLIMTIRNYKTLWHLSSPSGSDVSRAVLEFHQLYALAITLWMAQTLFLFVMKSMEVIFQ